MDVGWQLFVHIHVREAWNKQKQERIKQRPFCHLYTIPANLSLRSSLFGILFKSIFIFAMEFFQRKLGLTKSKAKPNNLVIGSLDVLKHSYLKDFRLQRVLGEGLSGKVRSCISVSTREVYAVKTLPDTPDSRAEIELQLLCSHPNIARIERVYSNVIAGIRRLVVIMELVPGDDLFERIMKRDKQPLTEKRVSEIVRSLCQVVAHLHDLNVAHRDIKPENILMSSKDDTAEIKLIDFGFAKACLGSDSLQTPCFTPYYAAPEVLSDGKYGKACDAWSIGVVTYILMCGYPPFSVSKKGVGARGFSTGMQSRIQAGTYKYPESEWEQVSSEGINFIQSLLNTDPSTRMTVQEALNHKWLSSVASSRTSPLLPRSMREVLQEGKEATSVGGKLLPAPQGNIEESSTAPAVEELPTSTSGDSGLADNASTDAGISLGSAGSVDSPSSVGTPSSPSLASSLTSIPEKLSLDSPLTAIKPIANLTNPLLERRRKGTVERSEKSTAVTLPLKRASSPSGASDDSAVACSAFSPQGFGYNMPMIYV